MAPQPTRIAFIGFGEAGMALAQGMACGVSAYDRKTDVGPTRRAKLEDYERLGVGGAATNKAAVSRVPLILSLVTAGRALAAARETARAIQPGALYCDLNSIAPETKRLAAMAIEEAGGRYTDVAVMAPVLPLRRAVPLLASGPHASEAAAALGEAGFADVRAIGAVVGEASTIKMVRSVMVKGIEALTAECALAAGRAGVLDEVIASLDASWPGADWRARIDYNLERMINHGLRRAAEMAEAILTLDTLGTGAAMSRATAERQRAIGLLELQASPGPAGKIAAILGRQWSAVA